MSGLPESWRACLRHSRRVRVCDWRYDSPCDASTPYQRCSNPSFWVLTQINKTQRRQLKKRRKLARSLCQAHITLTTDQVSASPSGWTGRTCLPPLILSSRPCRSDLSTSCAGCTFASSRLSLMLLDTFEVRVSLAEEHQNPFNYQCAWSCGGMCLSVIATVVFGSRFKKIVLLNASQPSASPGRDSRPTVFKRCRQATRFHGARRATTATSRLARDGQDLNNPMRICWETGQQKLY